MSARAAVAARTCGRAACAHRSYSCAHPSPRRAHPCASAVRPASAAFHPGGRTILSACDRRKTCAACRALRPGSARPRTCAGRAMRLARSKRARGAVTRAVPGSRCLPELASTRGVPIALPVLRGPRLPCGQCRAVASTFLHRHRCISMRSPFQVTARRSPFIASVIGCRVIRPPLSSSGPRCRARGRPCTSCRWCRTRARQRSDVASRSAAPSAIVSPAGSAADRPPSGRTAARRPRAGSRRAARSATTRCDSHELRSFRSFAQYSSRFLISRSKPRSGGS